VVPWLLEDEQERRGWIVHEFPARERSIFGRDGDGAATFLTDREAELLHRARSGDERAYAELVGAHRGALHAHCYRMLGSLDDADDARQDAMLRAWRGLKGFEARSSVRTWLYKIATNCCLQHVARRPRRQLSSGHAPAATPHTPPGEPLSESVWIEPYTDEWLEVEDAATALATRYEQRETIELAFVATLQPSASPSTRGTPFARRARLLRARDR
jgi:RNA polymerase sigma factor (sigma-70 family)